MIQPPLPEPTAKHDGGSFVWIADWLPTSDINYYTEAQLLAYRAEVIEMCAQVCEQQVFTAPPVRVANVIRSLK